MTMPEVVDYFARYAESFRAPVQTETSVVSVECEDGCYRVTTDQGIWEAPNVVIATGYCDVPVVPGMGEELSPDILQLVPTRYRNPSQLPDGGVLVVGAAASGIQLADELHRSGRDVTIAVGMHTRLPRRYRGRDIMYWLDATGIVDDTAQDVYDLEASRRQPSLQLVGGNETLDLSVLQKRGIRLVGRAESADGNRIRFKEDLPATTASADAKLERLLQRIDTFIARARMSTEVDLAAPKLPAVQVDRPAPAELDLRSAGIKTVIWATGFRRSYPWLKVPVTDQRGELIHTAGITSSPGLVALGLRFLRRRNSSFIDGVGRDANELATHIAERLEQRAAAVA